MAAPLQTSVAIVDDFGAPTPYMIQRWEEVINIQLELQDFDLTDLIADVADLDTRVTDLEGRNIIAGSGLSGGGDLTADVTLSLGDTAVTPGTYGSATESAQITVDQKGRITAASNVAISGGGGGGVHSAALVHKNADQTIIGGVTTTLTWESEAFDDDGWHSPGVTSSRLTVPAGVTRVRVSCNIVGSSTSNQLVLSLIKNGASFLGGFIVDTDTAGSDNLNASTGILEVVENDYFEVQAFSANTRDIDQNNRTWFAIEAVA